jgi:hypothetical protein
MGQDAMKRQEYSISRRIQDNGKRFFKRTPVRSFILYPLLAVVGELVLRGGTLNPNFWFLP